MPVTATHPTAENLTFIRNFIRDESAINVQPGKEYLLESRLMPIVAEVGFRDMNQLGIALHEGVSSIVRQRVIEAMTTNETSFFRDEHPFKLLKSYLVPQVMKRRRSQRKLTIWSAACSSGQEPYSIAMVLRENFPELASWETKIIATDLDRSILDKAVEGEYVQAEVDRGLSPALRERYFTRDGVCWKAGPELQSMIEFFPVNLIRCWPKFLADIDIVFVRNVLIYFTPKVKESILQRIARVMHPDGYLMLGSSETTMNLDVPLIRESQGRSTYLQPVPKTVA